MTTIIVRDHHLRRPGDAAELQPGANALFTGRTRIDYQPAVARHVENSGAFLREAAASADYPDFAELCCKAALEEMEGAVRLILAEAA